MGIDPVIGRAAIELRLARSLQGRLAALAAGRPLVIDYFASRVRGVVVGDLTVNFGDLPAEPCFIQLESLDGVVVLAQRRLLDLLEGAELIEAGPPWRRHPAVVLARPEDWIEFLGHHGYR